MEMSKTKLNYAPALMAFVVGRAVKQINRYLTDTDNNAVATLFVAGRVTLMGSLDRERQAVHHLMLTAEDVPIDGGLSLTGTSTLVVNVLDVDDNVPVIDLVPAFYSLDGATVTV